ncbi:hypothetical protein [Pseudomonas thivervalensis]|uniref:hypothetical protein n=1 Tax=Pseudomonas thivervalensis TaxID=86265 RepID=UPI003D6A14DC
MEEFVRSIPAAASSPYALAAYAIAAVIFLFAGSRLRLAKVLLDKIDSIPPEERRRTVEIATGTVLPTRISPEQWIRNNRLRWAFLLAASILIVILVIAIVAIVNPSAKKIEKLETIIEDGNQQVKIDLWRNRYGIGQVSGSAWITIDLDGKSSSELTAWLSRVEKRYKDLKMSNVVLDTDWLSSDLKGDEYLEINALTSPKRNWDLTPKGQGEQFVDELLFNSRYVLLSTSGEKHGLLLSTLGFNAEATSVKIYFDPVTSKPKKIDGHAQGAGAFNPVPGQFNNWVDFYGATLIARQLFLVTPLPAAFTLVEYNSITFDAKDNQWDKSATFSTYTGADLFTDERRSLIVKNADWKTLGQLPRDYPGKRLPMYGAAPEPW